MTTTDNDRADPMKGLELSIDTLTDASGEKRFQVRCLMDHYSFAICQPREDRLDAVSLRRTFEDALRSVIAAEVEASRPAPAQAGANEMVRRLLWIAYCWNDHNFDKPAEQFARDEAAKHGIKSFEDANRWLTQTPAAKEGVECAHGVPYQYACDVCDKVSFPAERRNVTAKEDQFLRNAAKGAATLVHGGKLAQGQREVVAPGAAQGGCVPECGEHGRARLHQSPSVLGAVRRAWER